MKRARLLAAMALWAALWPLRTLLESDMALHMTVQLPLLIGVGFTLATSLRPHEPRWLADADWLGIPGLLLVIFATSFWMLPRMLDLALADPWIDLAKFVSLPLLAGLPLGLSWRRMPGLGRAFIWANFIPKLGAIGGLYLAAPTRLCAYYRLDQQAAAGSALIAVAAALGISWFLVVFVGSPPFWSKSDDGCGRLRPPTSRACRPAGAEPHRDLRRRRRQSRMAAYVRHEMIEADP
ncbi:MAG TPA: hypothetical protein VKA03_08665 [Methylovirgula sp.]|nr:hypothetical protein [Methylovirgula sp.]